MKEVAVRVSGEDHEVKVSVDIATGFAYLTVNYRDKLVYYVGPCKLEEAVARIERLAAELTRLAREAAEIAGKALRP